MSRFHFRLSTLLRLREAARDQRRAELMEAYRVEEILQKQAESVRREMDWLQQRSRRAAGPGTVNVDQLVEGQRYGLTLKSQLAETARQQEVVAGEIHRRREVLLAADRDVRVLENLRDKQSQQHREEEERQDQRQLDEVATQSATRREVL